METVTMDSKQQYIHEVERKLDDWEAKLDHIRKKAERERAQSQWLDHTIEKHEEVRSLVEELRDVDDDEFERRKADVAIAAEELEVSMVRAAERFEEARELGLDAKSRKEGDASKG